MENEIYDDVFMQNNNSLIYERLFNAMEKDRTQIVEKDREKKWNSRFHLDPMPSYNVMKDKHAKMYTGSTTFISPNTSQQRTRIQPYEPASSAKQEQQPVSVSTSTRELCYSYTNNKKKRKISSASSTRRRSNSDNQKSTISDNGKSSSKPPLEQKKSLADIEAEHFFAKSKSRIQKLWSELRVPQDEIDRFSRIYLSKCSNDNIAIVTEEIKRLTEQRNLILSILKNIENRELLLETLYSLVERYGDEKIFSKHLVAREVKNIAASLRLCTLEIVESIVQWRNILQAPKPFVWRSKNYLLKIQTDLDFFLMSSLISLLPNVNPLKNPFLMPGIEFGATTNSQSLDKKSHPTSPNRKRPKFDSSPYLAGGSTALPPLSKLRQASPADNDPLKERILYAQKVVFSEGKGVNDSFGSQTCNSPSRDDKVVIAPYEELGGKEEEVGEENDLYARQIEEQRLKEERKRQLEEEQRMKEEKKRQQLAEKKKEEERLRKERETIGFVLIIQSALRGRKARQILAHEYKVEAERAAVKIQSQVRKNMAKKKVDNIKRDKSILIMQACYRGKSELAMFEYTKEFCSIIEACVEGMTARRAYFEEQNHNAITENIYGEEEEEPSVEEVEQDLSQFEKLVALCKGHLSRVVFRSELKAHKQQEADRLKQLKEEELRLEAEKREKAAIKIQSQIRSFLAKKKTQQVAEQKKQAFMEELEQERREYEAAREERKRLKQESAIITIQKSFRGYLGRAQYAELLRRYEAATKIQCMVRQKFARKKAMSVKQRKQMEMEKFLQDERAQYEALLAQL
ncbi:predicted protein [Naegleria gruberi]|uniref:Predicted protein n=1 Tax=Naegleria gruberi TaxID=5762 RepID=D2VCX3_NAEGR|nr:uncharacterized protein NAEGRDRAFT_66723 [Naegleria gruberi]EFC45378.1 predicted protein [Naegleria gruberi]|eukprot:XP_002678122.1 predicted protein [Naegleria gruberi strain NEG-M]